MTKDQLEKLVADDPSILTDYGKRNEINEVQLSEARKIALAPYFLNNKELTAYGAEFVATKRATKCRRKNCTNNLGQHYTGYGRHHFTGVESYSDRDVVLKFVTFKYWGIFQNFKNHSQYEVGQIEYRQSVAGQHGYCGPDCESIQVRADDKKGGSLSDEQKRLLKANGFTHLTGKVTWRHGNGIISVDSDKHELHLTIPVREGLHVTHRSGGTFSFDQLADAIAVVTNAKSTEYLRGEIAAETALTEREREELERLAGTLVLEITKLQRHVDKLRARYNECYTSALHAEIVANSSALHALRREAGLVGARLYGTGKLAETPLPQFLSIPARAHYDRTGGWEAEGRKRLFAPEKTTAEVE